MESRPAPSMEAKIDRLTVAVEGLDGRVCRLDQSIRGNGKEGLLVQHALVAARVQEVERHMMEVHAFRRWLSLGVVSLFGTVAWQVVQAVLVKP